MSDKEREVGQLFVELVEALSALGNYLSALNHMRQGQPPERFGEALERSIAQYERAADAARRLRKHVAPPLGSAAGALLGRSENAIAPAQSGLPAGPCGTR